MPFQYTDFNSQGMGAFNQGQQIGDDYVKGQLRNEQRERTSMLDAQNEQLAAQTASDRAVKMDQSAELHDQNVEIKQGSINKMEQAKQKQLALAATQMTYEERQPFLAEILKQTKDPIIKKNLQIVMDMEPEKQGESLWMAAMNDTNKSGEQKAFESLIAGFSPEDQVTARKVKAGLKGRAMSNAVLSAIQSGDIQNLADAKATIKGAEKFAEMSAASRGRTIDSGFEKIQKIDVGVRNIDKAIKALESGAGVGAIEKWLPSFKAASVELDNIQGLMALDVVGATTFGALSKGELDLAKNVALPTGLDDEELMVYLGKKKAAQIKLRAYFSEQIQHLDQGGTVASFLRMKERGNPQQPTAASSSEFAGFKVVR